MAGRKLPTVPEVKQWATTHLVVAAGVAFIIGFVAHAILF